MIRSSLCGAFALLIAAAIAAAGAPVGQWTAPSSSSLQPLTDSDIQSLLTQNIDTDHQSVGLAVGVVDTNGTHVVCHGKLDNGTDAAVDGNTLFEIGSVTKVFTALLLEDMVERGQMHLDDPVQKYLPASVHLPVFHGHQITLLHLATHTSGLPRDVSNMTPTNWCSPEADYSVAQFYDFLSHVKLTRAPGSREEYSNLGVSLLGYVIELKAGTNYETLLKERICRPLGMNSTCVTVPPELAPRLAIGHALPERRVCPEGFSFRPGAGGIHSSVNDLLKFAAAYAGITPSPLSSLMHNAEALHTMEGGARRRLVWSGDGSIFDHQGRTFGFNSNFAFDSQKRRAVVILSDCASSFITAIAMSGLLNGNAPQPARTATADVALFDRYAGRYQYAEGGFCNVWREGDALLIQWMGSPGGHSSIPGWRAYPVTDTVFRNNFWMSQATFIPPVNAAPPGLILADIGNCTQLTRVSADLYRRPAPVAVNGALFERFVGRYRKGFLFGLVHLGPTFSIYHSRDEFGDHLVGVVRGSHLESYGLDGVIAGAELFPVTETTYYSPLAGDLSVQFVPDKQDRTKGILIHFNGVDVRGDRVSPGSAE
jgi:CubicO group peptidase (beta-lactamase class C family)